MATDPPSAPKFWVLAPAQHVATIKQQLRSAGTFDTTLHIISDPKILQRSFDLPSSPSTSHDPNLPDSSSTPHNLVALPTTLPLQSPSNLSLLTVPGLSLPPNIAHTLHLATPLPSASLPFPRRPPPGEQPNALTLAVRSWLAALPPALRQRLPCTVDRGSWRFHKYPPLLVLPAGTFTREPWGGALAALPEEQRQGLYAHVAAKLGVSHVAEQGAIPLHTRPASGGSHQGDESITSTSSKADTGPEENVLRAPLSLRPLYGDFAPREPASESAFQRALWVSTRQHGVEQVWAPLYTMFANGNVNEKRRVAELALADREAHGWAGARVRRSGYGDGDGTQHGVQDMRDDVVPTKIYSPPGNVAAVDLYAGIGYFAFAYAKAGYRPVLCWELNAWSIEGLHRGAALNGWTTQVVSDDAAAFPGCATFPDEACGNALACTFVIFHETNARALQRIRALRGYLPPIRHVNCGYLPSSALSWPDAVHILDPSIGGWVHAHENVGVKDIETRAEEVVMEMDATAKEWVSDGRRRSAQCRHVERVKSYAPGVLHCVFDVLVGPVAEVEEVDAASWSLAQLKVSLKVGSGPLGFHPP